MNLLETTPRGLYCAQGDFYVDPWRPVKRAVVTHAHSDHARPGSQHYLLAETGSPLARLRLGQGARIQTLKFGESLRVGQSHVSLHPSGHMTGAAQVRIESSGQVWVVSGDYKLQDDPTCSSFEPIRCHTLVSESTFGLPIFRWEPPEVVVASINAWWRANQESGRCSVLYGYSLGKAQRLLRTIDTSIGPLVGHGAILNACLAYREAGVDLPTLMSVAQTDRGFDWSRALVVAPPSAHGTPWLRRFGQISTAMASGWMQVRGFRRRRALDRGFVLSDHADWPGLLRAIESSQAEDVWLAHGYSTQLARYLQSQGKQARAVTSHATGELADDVDDVEPWKEPEKEESGGAVADARESPGEPE